MNYEHLRVKRATGQFDFVIRSQITQRFSRLYWIFSATSEKECTMCQNFGIYLVQSRVKIAGRFYISLYISQHFSISTFFGAHLFCSGLFAPSFPSVIPSITSFHRIFFKEIYIKSYTLFHIIRSLVSSLPTRDSKHSAFNIKIRKINDFHK